jgi:hypothetical protein
MHDGQAQRGRYFAKGRCQKLVLQSYTICEYQSCFFTFDKTLIPSRAGCAQGRGAPWPRIATGSRRGDARESCRVSTQLNDCLRRRNARANRPIADEADLYAKARMQAISGGKTGLFYPQ